MKKSLFFKNLSWTLVSKFIQLFAQMLIGVFVARYLKPDQKGILDYVASFVTFGTSIVSMGVSGVIVNEFCNSGEKDGKILGSVMTFQLIVSAVTSAAILGLVAFLNKGDSRLFIIAVIELSSLLFGAFGTFAFWFQARDRMRLAAFIQLIAQFVVVLYKAVIIIFKCSILFFAFSPLLEAFTLAVLYFYGYGRYKKEGLSVSISTAKKIFFLSFPFLIADVMIFLYQCMDKIMIGNFIDKTTVAYYSAATTIANMWSLIPASFANVIRPKVMEAKKSDDALYRRRLTETFSGLIYCAIPFSVMMTFIGKYVIWVLYGADYLEGTSALRIVVWYCAFSYIGTGRSIYLICENKNRFVPIFCMWGAISNAILNIVLIPRFSIDGAAYATLLTQIIANIIVPFLFKETREYVGYVVKGLIRIDYVIRDIKEIFGRNG